MSGLLWSHPPLNSRKQRLVNDERANQITHALATALSVLGAVLLLHAASQMGQPGLTAACAVYALTLVLVYLNSTLSHSFLRGRWKHLFRTLDQISIFLLISGNFTPVGLFICQTGYWWLIPIAMWTLSLIGISMKLFVTGIQMVPVWFYVVIAWLPLLALPQLIEFFPTGGLLWIVAGGACYMSGIWFLCNDDRAPYLHCIWHVLVTFGSLCHFVVIYNYLLPGLQS